LLPPRQGPSIEPNAWAAAAGVSRKGTDVIFDRDGRKHTMRTDRNNKRGRCTRRCGGVIQEVKAPTDTEQGQYITVKAHAASCPIPPSNEEVKLMASKEAKTMLACDKVKKITK
jgi:hypothetical protein